MSAVRSRALPAAGLLVLTLPLVALGATPASAAVPGQYSVQTQAAAVLLTAQQNPPLGPVTNQLIAEAIGYAASSLDSGGGSQAAAAAFFPGNLVTGGPGLVCSQFLGGTPLACPTTPPPYPLLADAQYPTNTSSTATVTGQQVGGNGAPLAVTPLQASARAEQTHNSAQTSAADAGLLGGTPAPVSIGAVHSRTTTSVDASGVHVLVETTLSNVTIGSGLHIGALHSVDTLVVPQDGTPHDAPAITLSHVTLDGQSATIDSSGVHVAGHSGPALIRDAGGSGLSVHLIGTDRTDAAGLARSDAFGLQVTLDKTVSGAPIVCAPVPTIPSSPVQVPCPPDLNRQYLATLTLGAVGAVAAASKGLSFTFPAFSLPGSPAVGATPLAAAALGAVGAGNPPALPTGSLAAAGAGNPPTVATRAGPRFTLLSANLSTLALALAVGTAALFACWRLATLLALHRRNP